MFCWRSHVTSVCGVRSTNVWGRQIDQQTAPVVSEMNSIKQLLWFVNLILLITYTVAYSLAALLYKPVAELARARDGWHVWLRRTIPCVPNTHTSFMPPMRTSLCFTLHAAKQGVALLSSWKEFFVGSEVAPNASSPRVLSRMSWFFNTMF